MPLSNATISAICAAVGGCGRLGVPERRVLGLALEAGLAAVPHERGQELEIGGRQRAPVDREGGVGRVGEAGHRTGVATVRIDHLRHLELQDRRIRHRQADPDQALVDQQRIGLPPGGRRRDIVARTGGAVDQAEDRIGAAALREARRDAGRAHGPARLRLMAAEAGPSVGAEILEERAVEREGRAARLEGRHRAGRIAIGLEARNDRRCLLHALVRVLEAAHRLHVGDHAGREGRHAAVVVARERGPGYPACDAGQYDRTG